MYTAKIVSEYDQEIPQSQTVDNPLAPQEEPLNHQETPGRQIKQSNQLSLPHQDDCNTRSLINEPGKAVATLCVSHVLVTLEAIKHDSSVSDGAIPASD